MAWFKVDDALAFHMKVVTAGNAAMGLWVRAGSWSAQQLSDGFVPANIVRTFGGSDDDVRALCDVGLWHEVENGYQFHDWDEYQPTRDKVLGEREKARQRMADLRGRSPEQTANRGGSSGAVRPPRPVPSRPSINTPPAAVADGLLDRFDEFWEAYDKKVGRKAAEAKWAAAMKKGADPDQLIKAATVYIAGIRAKDDHPRFTKNPATWLNGEHWEDEPVGTIHHISRPEPVPLARLPKCPNCNAPQEITHYEECPDQAWRPTA